MSPSNGFGDIYHIIWYVPGSKSVGEVRNYTSDLRRYRRIAIFLGDDLLKRMRKRFLMTEWTAMGPKIGVSTFFMTIPRSLREAGIWHEVGHIHHGHRCHEEIGNRTGREASRVMMEPDHESLKNMEAAADRFAVLQSSKETVKGFLEYILRTGPSPLRGGWNEIERRELKARITSIRAY